MGFLKWLDKQLRASNEKSRERDTERAESYRIWREERDAREKKEQERRQAELDNMKCCANCRYAGYMYGCKNSYNGNNDRYDQVCSEFEWKQE